MGALKLIKSQKFPLAASKQEYAQFVGFAEQGRIIKIYAAENGYQFALRSSSLRE